MMKEMDKTTPNVQEPPANPPGHDAQADELPFAAGDFGAFAPEGDATGDGGLEAGDGRFAEEPQGIADESEKLRRLLAETVRAVMLELAAGAHGAAPVLRGANPPPFEEPDPFLEGFRSRY